MPTCEAMTTDWLYQFALQLGRQRLQSQAIMQMSLQKIRALSGAAYGCIALLNGQEQISDVYTNDAENLFTQELWELGLLHNLTDAVHQSERPIFWNHLTFQDGWDRLNHPTFRQPGSAAAVPLDDEGLRIGVIVLMHGQPNAFDPELAKPLCAVAPLVAAELANARQFEQLAYAFEDQAGNDRLRRDLSAMILHDLRGPLNNILASLSRLSRLNDPTTAHALAETAEQSARHMGRMVKSLLDVEKLESNEKLLKLELMEPGALLSEAAALVRGLAQEAGQSLDVRNETFLPEVPVDHDMIVRVITNLLENAVKHTPEGGHILLAARLRETAVQFMIVDSGPGIPAQMQRAIFDKYVRLKRDMSHEGYGLGLAFCRLAVDAHGGEIWVEDAEGGGSVFTFTLPIAQEVIVVER